jgi:ribonuclease D
MKPPLEPLIELVHDDLPPDAAFGDGVAAIDTETTGLSVTHDKLCLCQVGDSAGRVWLVKFGADYAAPRLRALLADPGVLKIFHFARFDVAQLQRHLGVTVAPVFCTKIAHKLVKPDSTKHNLRTLVLEYCGVELDKGEQMSDWAAPELTAAQRKYAALDVFYLARVWEALREELARTGRAALMQAALDFLPARVEMDLAGLPEGDLLAH